MIATIHKAFMLSRLDFCVFTLWMDSELNGNAYTNQCHTKYFTLGFINCLLHCKVFLSFLIELMKHPEE